MGSRNDGAKPNNFEIRVETVKDSVVSREEVHRASCYNMLHSLLQLNCLSGKGKMVRDSSEPDADEEMFPLWIEEKCIVDELISSIRLLFQRFDLRPSELRDLAALILGLEMLPYPTPDLEVDLIFRYQNEDGSRHQSLRLSDSVFNLSSGGYYKSEFGGDSYGDDLVDMEIGGYRNEEAPLWASVSGWLRQFQESVQDPAYELEVSCSGHSELEWDYEPDDDRWDCAKSYTGND